MAELEHRDIGIVAFVPDNWNGVWTTRHHVLFRLANHFDVLWMESARGWRESLVLRDRSPVFSTPDPERGRGFTVYRPSRWFPKVYRPKYVGTQLEKLRVEAGIRFLKKRGCHQIVGYLWRPDFASSLFATGFDLRCYHIDDEYSWSETETPMDAAEKDILRRVDCVFIHSPALMEKKGRLNSNTVYVPNGVDTEAFSAKYDEPENLIPIRRPIVGFIGVIRSSIDWQLLCKVAKQKKNVSFVFIGPIGRLTEVDRKEIESMKSLDHVHFLGGKDVSLLPAYTQHLDVCIMPYRINAYTRYIFPLKVNEYLAAGKPTIGTPIRSLLDYGSILSLAESPGEWITAIEESLKPECSSPDRCDQRRRVAQQYDWRILTPRIAQTLIGELAR